MNLTIIGYGKMGKTIERLATAKGHNILLKVDAKDTNQLTAEHLKKTDVAIEFTCPESAADNIKACLLAGIPIVSGTTAWLDKWEEVTTLCTEIDGAFFYASNYSIGMNIFFEVNKKLAALMNGQAYKLEMEEIHHTHKLDAPSGTAITIAEDLLAEVQQFDSWYLKEYPFHQKNDNVKAFPIVSKREGQVPGTHIVRYDSPIDSIEIKHEAKGREGFALGAIAAAEWLMGRKGIFGMKDLLSL